MYSFAYLVMKNNLNIERKGGGKYIYKCKLIELPPHSLLQVMSGFKMVHLRQLLDIFNRWSISSWKIFVFK